MAKNKKLGKIVAQVGGYRVRQMMENRDTSVMDRFDRVKSRSSKMCFTGKFGIYAGRKLCKDGIASLEKAAEIIRQW